MCGLRCCICPPRPKGNDDSQFAASGCWTGFNDFLFVNPFGRISAHVVLLVLSLAAYIIFFLGVFLEQVAPDSYRPDDEKAMKRFTMAKILLMTFGVGLWVAVVAAWVWICVKQKFWKFEEKKLAADEAAGTATATAGEATAAATAAHPGFFARAAGSLLHGRNRHSGPGSEHGASGADGAADSEETPAWARGWSSNESSAVWDPRAGPSGTQDPQ
jgi:hypothetical protein